MSENVITPEFRVSYPNLFQPRLNDQSGKMEYSFVALFAKGADLSALKKEAQRALLEKFGAEKLKDPAFVQRLRSPFRDQGIRQSDGYVPGAIFVSLKSTQKPGVVDAQVKPIIDPSQVYAGCYGIASVRAFAYDAKGNVGVSLWMQNFQKTRDGDSLTGRLKPEEEFEPIAAATEEATGAAGAPGIFD